MFYLQNLVYLVNCNVNIINKNNTIKKQCVVECFVSCIFVSYVIDWGIKHLTCFMLTSVAPATESSGYVWFSAPVLLVNLLFFIAIGPSLLTGILKIIVVRFPSQRIYQYSKNYLCYCWETIYKHPNVSENILFDKFLGI